MSFDPLTTDHPDPTAASVHHTSEQGILMTGDDSVRAMHISEIGDGRRTASRIRRVIEGIERPTVKEQRARGFQPSASRAGRSDHRQFQRQHRDSD